MSRAADHAYAEIRGLILSGELRPGERLTEEGLAARCAVSRTPVRDALRRLEADLLVVRSGGSRLSVAELRPEDVEELFTLRAMLEAHAAARAAARMDAYALRALETANDRLLAAIAAPVPDMEAFVSANRAFHGGILDAASSPRLVSALASLVERPIINRTAAHYSAAELRQSADEHGQLVQALSARDAEWAAGLMRAHIRRAFHAFLQASVRGPDSAAR
jgi:DNA-binding GntR family transcriptional regulator